ncbi:helix-turn-helix domain-containing protein [Streptomyces albogriseolus]|uniref:helix-turn-helix domain-containing protein n=1 Tax=Streptomyces albogriseolus TaxID=1887 RepID=UPI0037BC8BFB
MSAQDEVTEFAALLRKLKGRTDRSYGRLARRLHMNTSTLHRYCAGDAVPVDFAPVERFAALCGATDAERLELHRLWLRAAETRRRPRGGAATDASGAAGEGRSDATGHGSGLGAMPSGAGADAAATAARLGGVPGGSRSGAPEDGRPGDLPPQGGRAGAAAHGGRPDAPARGGGFDSPREDRSAACASADSGRPSRGGAADAAPNGEQVAARSDAAEQANDFSHAEGPGERDTHVVSGPVGHGHEPARRRWPRKRVVVALAALCAVLATVGSLPFLPDDRETSGSGAVGAAEGRRESGAGDSAGPARSVAPTGSPSASTSPSPSPSSSSSSARHGGNGAASKAPRPTGSATAPDHAPAGPPPLTWSVNDHAWAYGCGHDYVVAKPPAQVPPPPAPQDARTWAATQGAVHGGETLVELSVQGTSDTAVVLTALRVRVAGRSEPAPGNAYAMDQGCGGALTPRYFDVDLDKDRPIARAVAGNDAGTPIPAVRMPYRVSASDPEVLMVTARTEGCDCRWYLELDWSSQGRTGTVRIDDRGRPFRTSAVEGLPHYEYDTLNRSWRTGSS